MMLTIREYADKYGFQYNYIVILKSQMTDDELNKIFKFSDKVIKLDEDKFTEWRIAKRVDKMKRKVATTVGADHVLL
jgi:arsenate reductase-like glutaredoxin family protein